MSTDEATFLLGVLISPAWRRTSCNVILVIGLAAKSTQISLIIGIRQVFSRVWSCPEQWADPHRLNVVRVGWDCSIGDGVAGKRQVRTKMINSPLQDSNTYDP